MTRISFTYWRIAFALAVPTVVAQQCYYPNGAEAPEKPCSSADGSACCPDKWECLDNGLCHYPPDNLYGRYSCTDQSWKAEGCPSNMCTYDMSAGGGESITQCSDHNNQWCCNADAQHVNCCKESPSPRPFFALADGKAYATIGSSTASNVPNLATITGQALEGGNSASQTPSPSTAGSNSPQSTTNSANTMASPSINVGLTTQLQTTVSSGTAGIITVVKTVISSPTATFANQSSTTKTSSRLPVIVGCAVGIPLALALLGILIWLLRKRSTQAKHNNHDAKLPFADEILTEGSPSPTHGFIGGAKHNEKPPIATYKSTAGVPELSGNGIGPGRPISTIDGHAELDSGSAFMPGAQPAHAPQFVGLGGGTGTGHTPHGSWGSVPNYSPNMNHEAAPTRMSAGYNEADSQPGSANLGPPPGGYIPYRPNNFVHPHQAEEMATVTTPPAQEMNSVTTPPAAELSAVKTPPA